MTSRRLNPSTVNGANNFVKAALTEATAGQGCVGAIHKALRLFRQILSRTSS